MKTRARNISRNGLTRVELVVVVAIIVILVGITLLSFQPKHGHHGHTRSRCVNNLKQIGLAFRIYANDHNDLYPMQIPDDQGGAADSVERGDIVRVFLVLSNELSVPKTVICPADTRVAATNWNVLSNAHISYFIGLDAVDTQPNMILAGDRHLKRDGLPLSGMVALGTNSSLAWADQRHQESGNIVLADGSVQQVTTELLRQQLINSGDTTNLMVFPQ